MRRRESAVSIGSSTGLGVLAISGEVNAEKHETSPSCSVALFGGSQFRRLLSTGSNQDRLGRRIKLAERGVPISHTVEILVNDQVSVLSHDVTCRVCDTLF